MTLTGRRILITGAAGFIGRRLALRLRELGATLIPWTRQDVDIRRRKATIRLMEQAAPEIVVHLATSMRGRADSFVGRPVDLLMAIHILEAIAIVSAPVFLHVGTLDEYGNGPTPFSETQGLGPLTSYAAAKASAGLFWTMAGGVHVRLPIVYGPGQDQRFFISQLLHSLKSATPLPMSPGHQVRDFIYVDDVVEGLVRLLSLECAGQFVNLCTGTGYSLTQVVTIAQSVTGQIGCVQPGALPYREREVFHCVGSPRKLESLTGWHPQVSLESGLQRTLAAL